MIIERSGQYGTYYGTVFTKSELPSPGHQQTNAEYIYKYLTVKGWTPNAIAGILGNMFWESGFNPGRWQADNVGNMRGGYGLVQWTPATNHTVWCSESGFSDPSTMDANLAHIIYELENGLQYYKTDLYPLTFRQFAVSTESPYYLACAFAWNYERSDVVLNGSASEKQELRELRGGSANYWYQYLTGYTPDFPPFVDPETPTETKPKKKSGFNFVLFNHRRRMHL